MNIPVVLYDKYMEMLSMCQREPNGKMLKQHIDEFNRVYQRADANVQGEYHELVFTDLTRSIAT